MHFWLCRANDLPFARYQGVPYEDFVLNIQPDDYPLLNSKVQRILDSPKRLRHMQASLLCSGCFRSL